jgi:hypothetical protein
VRGVSRIRGCGVLKVEASCVAAGRCFVDSNDALRTLRRVRFLFPDAQPFVLRRIVQRIVCTCGSDVYAIPCDAVHPTGVWVRIESTLERQIGQSLDGLRADFYHFRFRKNEHRRSRFQLIGAMSQGTRRYLASPTSTVFHPALHTNVVVHLARRHGDCRPALQK